MIVTVLSASEAAPSVQCRKLSCQVSFGLPSASEGSILGQVAAADPGGCNLHWLQSCPLRVEAKVEACTSCPLRGECGMLTGVVAAFECRTCIR